MRTFLPYAIIVFLLLGLGGSLFAQKTVDDNLGEAKTLILLSPQHLIRKQFRIEIDRKIVDRHWLSLSPRYIRNPSREQEGFGAGLHYKFFLRNRRTYFSAGGSLDYNLFSQSATDNGTSLSVHLFDSRVMQYSVDLVSGIYLRLLPYLYGDIYYGLGYRFSTTRSTDGLPHKYRQNVLDYGYSGPMLILGIRIGFML